MSGSDYRDECIVSEIQTTSDFAANGGQSVPPGGQVFGTAVELLHRKEEITSDCLREDRKESQYERSFPNVFLQTKEC